jgi:hypothetical protein
VWTIWRIRAINITRWEWWRKGKPRLWKRLNFY